jgi:hypothetical protein
MPESHEFNKATPSEETLDVNNQKRCSNKTDQLLRIYFPTGPQPKFFLQGSSSMFVDTNFELLVHNGLVDDKQWS